MKRFLSTLLAVMILFALPGCSGNNGSAEDAGMNWQEQYDLGIRYLSEGNYEEAIIAFTAAIQIDPKRVDAYVSLADVYVELGDMENAIAILESGYAQTQDEALQAYLDSLTAQTAVGPHGETPFEQRNGYQDYETMTAEQQSVLQAMVAGLQAKDRAALEDVAIRFWEAFPERYATVWTQDGTYKMMGAVRRDAPDNLWIVMEIRPQTGMGYYAQIQPEAWLGREGRTFQQWKVWEYASCECVDWQPEGTYAQESEDYQYYEDYTMYSQYTGSGTAAGGICVSATSSSTQTNLTTGKTWEHTSEDTFENGHPVYADGPVEFFRSPLDHPNIAYHEDWNKVFW